MFFRYLDNQKGRCRFSESKGEYVDYKTNPATTGQPFITLQTTLAASYASFEIGIHTEFAGIIKPLKCRRPTYM